MLLKIEKKPKIEKAKKKKRKKTTQKQKKKKKRKKEKKKKKKRKLGFARYEKNGAAAHDADGALTRPRPSVPFGDPKTIFTWDANELARACGRAARVPRRGVRAHARARPLPLGAGHAGRGDTAHGQPMLVARFPGGHRRADFVPEGA